MAVEVASHQVYNVSADVYSWAMVCYEIFTMEKPFNGWTRDMHANLVCGRGARPDPNVLPAAVRPILEVSWSQYAYRRPTMRHAEQKMKRLEEQQLLVVCAQESQYARPDYTQGLRKMPNRTISDTNTASTVSISTESLSSFMYR
jgi:Protein tyrosine and serine/threonine kinase